LLSTLETSAAGPAIDAATTPYTFSAARIFSLAAAGVATTKVTASIAAAARKRPAR
jgi:hypothetical protein